MGEARSTSRWRTVATGLAFAVAAAVVAAPLAAQQAAENVQFDDRLGTLPVEVRLCHNGYSSLDTGILGTVYWKQTGRLGFGACVRATQPPEAGGTLSSYVDEKFIRANAELIGEPDAVAAAYGHQFVQEFRTLFLKVELFLVGIGLLVVMATVPLRRRPGDDRTPWWGQRVTARLAPHPVMRVVVWPVVLVGLATAASTAYAAQSFSDWSHASAVGTTYQLPGVDRISFSSPQTREIASQVQPFIEKNTVRLRDRAAAYEAKATASFGTALVPRIPGLRPRTGEKIVLAEADPQGSLVGTDVRAALYPVLLDALGPDAVALRTISGDVSSNGTVAEDGFIRDEARSLRGVPTVAVAGDHDSGATVKQMKDHGISVPNLTTMTVAGTRVTGANDPEFKTLFGGSVTNPSGVTEVELGERLRETVPDDQASVVLLHQPVAAAAYLGLDDLDDLDDLDGLATAAGSRTTPYDDGIDDLPPGVVEVGHLHRSIGPFVIWNTGTDKVTWTVVDQLGTSGGVENNPTFNRFSTPFSTPLKPISIRLQYLDTATGLMTGYATITVDPDGTAAVTARTDVGLPLDR